MGKPTRVIVVMGVLFLFVPCAFSQEVANSTANDILTLGNLVTYESSIVGLSLVNNFLFFIPPLAWNIAFGAQLPMDYFSRSAPPWITVAENIFRYSAMAYSFLLPINTGNELFMPGLVVYSVGMLAYIASWLVLMFFPDSPIAQSVAGRFGPAYLPIVWLGGIGMMTQSPVFGVLSGLFVGFHITEYAFRYSP